jgi:ferric-dicitrate binding protein FerR (iron transport regulator)
MTRSTEDVQRLLETLGEGAPPELDATEERARRERIGSAVDDRLERLAAARARRRRTVFAAGLGAAFAAGAAAAWLVVRPSHLPDLNAVATLTSDRPVELRHHGTVQASTSARLQASDEVHTRGDATATAILVNGASVEIDPDSTVRFDARAGENPGQDLRLGSGTVSLRVPKLGHRTLSVVTADTRVTVRGTRFAVSFVGDGERRETRVRVTEGSVWVDHAGKEDVLAAGQSWTSRPELAAAVAAEPPRDAEARNAAPVGPPPGMRGATVVADARATTEPSAAHHGETAESTLTAENELYHGAAASIRAGQDARAVGLLETFLSRFPRSPLAQSADIERLRALVRLGRREAAEHAARQYLSGYPHGFAREEARAVLSGARAESP